MIRFIIAYFLVLFSLQGQQQNIHFENIPFPVEVNTNTANCFLQSKDGFLWIGTGDGLVRYDGYNAVKIPMILDGATTEIIGVINALEEDNKGCLWIGTQNALYKYNTKLNVLTVFEEIQTTKRLNYRTLYKTSKNEMAIGTSDGFYLYHLKSKKIRIFKNRKGFEKSISSNIIRCFLEDSKGNIWVGTYDGLNKMNRKNGTFQRFHLKEKNNQTELQNNLILDIKELVLRDSIKLLVGTETGFVVLDIESKNKTYFYKGEGSGGLSNNAVKSIEVVAENEIWLGTDMGLNVVNLNSKEVDQYFYNANNSSSISNNIIPCLLKDKDGNIWVGTDNGMNKTNIHKSGFINNRISENDAYFDRSIEVVAADFSKEGKMWFATDEGFCSYDTIAKKYQWYGLSKNLSKKITDLMVDKEGCVWLATPQGLHIYNPSSNETYSYFLDKGNPEALQTNYINSLLQDSEGNVWVGTYKKGLYRTTVKNKKSLKFTKVHMQSPNGEELFTMSRKSIYGGTSNNLWLATAQGLKELDVVSGEVKSFETENKYVQNMYFENEANLWMVITGELYRYYIPEDKLEKVMDLSEQVQSFVVDERYIWYNTFRNLYRIKKDGTAKELISMRSTNAETYNKFAMRLRDGRFLFGTGTGFLTFDSRKIHINKTAKPIQFTEFKVLNKTIKPSSQTDAVLDRDINYQEEISLSYEQNTFSIGFSTLDFQNQENQKYAYLLEGYDSDWKEVTGMDHMASYTRVKPGTYTFKVKPVNIEADADKFIRSLVFKVHPPLWASNWAILFYLVLLIAILWLSRKLLVLRINDVNNLKLEKLQRIKSDELVSSKSKFFTNISHELKTPLTLILSPTERLLKEENDEKKIETLKIIKRNTERMMRLVNQVLDVRKIETGKEKLKLEKYDLVKFTNRLVSLFDEEATHRKITLTAMAEIENLVMLFDIAKIEKVIFNLISNAFKFTPDEGKIALETSVVERDEKQFACIAVSDTGIGISGANQEKIFQRFIDINSDNYTSQEGTGIGLSLVKDYVELHKGFIELESEEGKGSTFKIYLPLDESYENIEVSGVKNLAKNDAEILDEAIDEEGSNKLKLLVIEDDRDMRNFVASSFEDEFEVILAADGLEGYEKIKLIHPDIIISDVMMPKMDGITLCKKVKSDIATSHIPLILLTAKGSIDDKMEGIGVGADDYILKPFHLDYLLLRTKMLISKKEKKQQDYLEDTSAVVTEIVTNPLDEKFMNQLLETIEKELDNSDLSVQLLAQFMQMDKTSLYRKIKSLTGQTATAFIRNTRLKRAAELLKQPHLNVSEVMYTVGYTHRSYFTRSFKELFGEAPSDYRNKFKK